MRKRTILRQEIQTQYIKHLKKTQSDNGKYKIAKQEYEHTIAHPSKNNTLENELSMVKSKIRESDYSLQRSKEGSTQGTKKIYDYELKRLKEIL